MKKEHWAIKKRRIWETKRWETSKSLFGPHVNYNNDIVHKNEHEPEIDFFYIINRSEKSLTHSRRVHTILDCLVEIGGLNIALFLLLQPFFVCFFPAVKASTILDENFAVDNDEKDSLN